MQYQLNTNMDYFFEKITSYPKTVVLVSLCVIIFFGSGIKFVVKDPSVDAFVPDTHPTAVTRDLARTLFGLEDPIVIGLSTEDGSTAFTPNVLSALRSIEAQVRQLPNVNKHDLVSILSESAISSNHQGLDVKAILEDGEITQETASLARQRLLSMPMMVGLLASKTTDTVTLIVPVKNPNTASDTYYDILQIARANQPDKVMVNVTGVASMNGRLAQMVDHDTRIFIPIAIANALLIIWMALKTAKGLIAPLFVIAGAAAITIGVMGLLGARYYLITTALPVIIMAISIADSLHISTIFFREQKMHPECGKRHNLLNSIKHTFVPVTLTTITTAAGFTGLAIGSGMQPIAEFGWFAAIGAVSAWALSLTLLPAILMLVRFPTPQKHRVSIYSRVDELCITVTQLAFNKPWHVGGFLIILLSGFIFYAGKANFDYERQRYFQSDDPVRVADVTLNQKLSGLNFLDVVISSPEPFGLMTPQAMRHMQTLQFKLNQQPLVNKTSSIVDYMSLMHRLLVEDGTNSLPTKKNAPAQYMFLYEASGDPDDFSEEIDFQYQHALLRAQLSSDRFSLTSHTVEKFKLIAKQWSQKTGLNAAISGRVAVNHGWMSLLQSSHIKGLGLAIILVFCASVLAFKAVLPAILTLIPLLTGVLFTYACMGALDIDIAPATSMTAAISTGLGVDFAIHLIWQVRHSVAKGFPLHAAFSGRYIVVARACFYSAVSLAIALAVICLSSAPPLRWFGGLVAAAACGSLVGAIVILPAVYALSARISRPFSNIRSTL